MFIFQRFQVERHFEKYKTNAKSVKKFFIRLKCNKNVNQK